MKEKKNMVLNQHSALTTFQLEEGDYFSSGVEKSVFALLFRSQQDMKGSFKNILKEKLQNITGENNIDNLIDWIYTGKEHEISPEEIDMPGALKLTREIIGYREDEILRRTGNEDERKKLSAGLSSSFLGKLAKSEVKQLEYQKSGNTIPMIKVLHGKTLEQTEENIQLFFQEVKEYCRDLAVKEHINLKSIDLTALSSTIETNLTYLKKDLKKAVGTRLKFNYINRKKLDVDVVSSLVASVSFENDKSKKTTWMSYQIPVEILNLLLLPQVYVPLNGIVIQNLKGIYSFRMYGLLNDHIKRGEVEITKEELFNFFMLPDSYSKKAHLINKFLNPTLHEVEINSGIKTEYSFYPERGWDKIIFRFKKVNEVVVPELKLVTPEDIKKDLDQNEDRIQSAIAKMKRNIYVSRAWNKYAENKIYKIVREEGADFAITLMGLVYSNLKADINTTLVQYINGVLKNIREDGRQEAPKKGRGRKKAQAAEPEVLPKEDIQKEAQPQVSDMSDLLYNIFLDMREERQEEIRNRAKALYLERVGLSKLGPAEEKFFKASEKSLIIEILKETHK